MSAAQLVLRSRGGGVSMRVAVRPIAVGAGLAAAVAALAIVAIGIGDYPVSPGEVVSTLLGGGTRATSFIIETLRLPRVLCAVLVGIALGAAGAMFQSLTGNPLGSPDVIGFTTGAGAGALFVITVLGGSGLEVSGGALAGGLVTGALVYGLAFKRRGVRLPARARRDRHERGDARADRLPAHAGRASRRRPQATVWLVGSLNGRGWDQVRPLAGALVVLVPAALLPDAARCGCSRWATTRPVRSGSRVERARLALVVVAIALVAVGDGRGRADRVRGPRGAAARAAARAPAEPRHRDLRAHGRARWSCPATSRRSGCSATRSCPSGS